MMRRSPLAEVIPIRDPVSPRPGQGPRVLVVADERDLAVRAHLRSSAVALAAAGYRLSFVAASQDALISAVSSRLRERTYALVHVHGAELAAVGCLAGVLSMPPLLVSLREPPRETGVRRWLLGRALAAGTIVTACEDDRAAVLRLFPNLRRRQERIITIADGVEAPLTPPAPLSHTGQRGEQVRRIGCFAADAGREALLEAFARLVRFGNVPTFRVEAFGGAGDALRQAIERRGLQSLIRVGEAVDFASGFDLFVVPSRAGVRAAMQALCAGVPLIAAGLREIVEGTPARVCLSDAASLEVALREALSDPWTDEARAYAPKARDRFDARRAAGRLVELYDRLTADVGAA